MDRKSAKLAKRESEILEAIYLLGEASARDLEESMENPPSNAAIRTLLGILVDKGHLKFKKKGRRYIYTPTLSREKAGRSALSNAIATFFEGSLSQAVAGLLSSKDSKLNAEELERLEALIAKAKQKENSKK
ncbi:MAG: BlaI/MecI/CopY family transcriptional regulator [Verrucomicrobiota bacterium]